MREREDEIPAAGKVRRQEALSQLIKLHGAWDRPTEAARLEDVKTTQAPPISPTEPGQEAAESRKSQNEGEPEEAGAQ